VSLAQRATAPKRPACTRCLRPLRACLCQWITPTANEVAVLILQHPLEVQQAKGSARLLQLSLQGCTLQVGEVFEPADLQAWLQMPVCGQPARNVLLYPDADPQADMARAPAKALASPAQAANRLVVLDGTWRKSRKMLTLNPLLHTLPRLALQPDAPSRYLIRKAHRPDQLSTLEATCLALAQLAGLDEGAGAAQAGRHAPLLAAFDRFMAASAAWRGGAPHNGGLPPRTPP